MIRVSLLCFALIALTACETAKGAGRDIEKAGDAIADTAQNVQNSLYAVFTGMIDQPGAGRPTRPRPKMQFSA